MIYAEVKRFDETQYGRIRYIGDADPLPARSDQILFIDLTGRNPMPEIGWYYDAGTDLFSEAIPAGAVEPKETLTAVQLWMGSLTDIERAKVWAVCNGEDVPGVTINLTTRYRLAAFRDISLSGQPIPLHADETVTVVNGMESAGILDPGRAAEILT